MFAFEIPGSRFSLPAGADVERFRFVSINSNSAGIPATAATAIVGVSMNKAESGKVLEIADGLVMVEASGAITAGALVYADASGKATATKGTAEAAGVAIVGATGAGDIITVKM